MTTGVLVQKDPLDPNFGVPFSERLTNCAEFAFKYLLTNGGTLVHGSMFREGVSVQRNGHCWVLTDDGSVFEPTMGIRFPTHEIYLRWADAVVDITYSREEAVLLALQTGHFGIWHDDPSGAWGDMG